MDLAELRTAMEADERAWNVLLAGGLDPDAVVKDVDSGGYERDASVGIRLAQALMHGTEHRSQVCTAITTLGIEPPGLDVWDYGDDTGRVVEIRPRPDVPEQGADRWTNQPRRKHSAGSSPGRRMDPRGDRRRWGAYLLSAYTGATANRRHSPGTPFSSCSPRSSNSMTGSRHQILDGVPETSTSPGLARDATRAPMCTAMPRELVAHHLALAGVQPRSGYRLRSRPPSR